MTVTSKFSPGDGEEYYERQSADNNDRTRGGAGKLRTGNILNGGDLVAEVWIDINYL